MTIDDGRAFVRQGAIAVELVSGVLWRLAMLESAVPALPSPLSFPRLLIVIIIIDETAAASGTVRERQPLSVVNAFFPEGSGRWRSRTETISQPPPVM